ncbi:hypothetical protein [Actinocrinis sp.]|uniref:hypothetical protein n=1 Tax=Actinocrinis sp. TaxID=1920516 RepID=UPI002D5EB053|nr:hypothetical protein [Actinocrinis sp.]HZP53871.1 hypothetical protein [Actinocrinis sp.]
MGYTRHNAILVTTSGHILRGESEIPAPDIDAFRATLPEDWQHLVIGPVKSLVNDYVTFAFLPDGSKEGWDTSDDGDEYRRRFLELFAYAHDDRSVPSDVLVVDACFGGDEPGAGNEPELLVTTNVPRATITGRVYQCED